MSGRQARPVVLLTPVPADTPVHRLWAGTKLVVVFGISVLLTFYPGWIPISSVALVLVLAAWIARIPRGALPSVPLWLWFVLLVGGITGTLGGGQPLVSVFSWQVELGGLLNFLKITAVGVVLLGLGAMVSWTTNVAEIAPAVAVLGRPLRWLRLPVQEWSVALALALRAFPMMIEEFRVLYAARRMRPALILPTGVPARRRWLFELVDLLAAAITVTLRRADEMGDAITARGGTGQISAARSRPGPADWVALLVVTLICGGAMAVEIALTATRG